MDMAHFYLHSGALAFLEWGLAGVAIISLAAYALFPVFMKR